MDIHNVTGTVAEPLGTLEQQLGEETKNALQKTIKTVVKEASYAQRTRWWVDRHPVQTISSAFVLGFLASLAFANVIKKD